MNKIFKLIRELKKMTIPQVAEILGVHHSAVGAFELYGHGLGVEKIGKYASLLGFSVIVSEIFFNSNVVHVYYLPVLAGLRKVNLKPFFELLKLCNITVTQIVLFTEKKHVKAIVVQDLKHNVFVFLPRRVSYVAKIKDLENEIQERIGRVSVFKTEKIPEKPFESLQKSDLEKYFMGVYCYTCPKIAAILPDGKILYYPVVPIGSVLEDFYQYLLHEQDQQRKSYAIENLLSFVFAKILKNFDKDEYDMALKKAREIWGF